MKSPLQYARSAWVILYCRWVLVLCLSGAVHASDFSVTTWGVDEGLPQSSVTDIVQTPDGFLWIGTLMSGLSRFDGVQFQNFNSANTTGLLSPGVRRLLADKQGNLWVNDSAGNLLLRQGNSFIKVGSGIKLSALVGEWGGRVVFSTMESELLIGRCGIDGEWSWQRFPSPMPGSRVYYHEDAEGEIWFRTTGGKLGRLEKGKLTVLDSPPGLGNRNVRALARDESGQIWVGTDAGLARWCCGSFTNMNPVGAAEKFSVWRITPTTSGGLWVEVENKLFYFDQNHWHESVSEWGGGETPWARIRSVRGDNSGGLWASLSDEGLAHVDRDGKLERMTDAEGLPSLVIQTLFCDSEGNLWGGYHRGGLVQLRKKTFRSLTQAEGLSDTLITSVTEDKTGTIWLGTAGGLVAQWVEGNCKILSLPGRRLLNQNVVVCAGPDGRVWLGTGENGLWVWDQGGFHLAIPPGQISQGVRQLLVTKNGEVWFANLMGLYRFNGEKLDLVLAASDHSQAVTALAEAPDGAIWLGMAEGALNRWKDGKLTTYQPPDLLPSNRLWALLPEPDGTVWASAMNAGLLRFKDGQFTRFTMADGLADNYISHILADDLGNLWLGSGVGVMCVSKKNLVSKVERTGPILCRLFGRTDGLPTVAMTLEFSPSCVKAHDGALWFGSPKGASWVRPENVRSPAPAPSVYVESVWADRQPVDFDHGRGSSVRPKISVPPGINNIEVRYSAPDFIAPKLIQFKYRLEPLDTEWQDLDSRRNVVFNHLPPGEYFFRVTAVNSDGVWDQKEASFRLSLQPHFWERKTFQFGALLTFLTLVILVVRRITHHRLRRKLEVLRQQQQIERERARIARDLHDDLGASLTEISLTSDFAQSASVSESEAREHLRAIGGRAREMVHGIDEIIWAVNPRNDTITSLAAFACRYAQQLFKPSGIGCRFDLQPDLPEVPLNSEQRYNFFLAFKETLNNIARHSQATEMRLAIYADNGNLFFKIEDNGCGFQLGVEIAEADGLRNIRERIESIGGQCEICSQPGQGTKISLNAPLTAPAKTEVSGSNPAEIF